LETTLPHDAEEFEDIDYQPKRDTAQELVDYWRRSQKELDKFWEVWKANYLLSLRETLPLSHKGSRSQLSRLPKVGEIVIIKDDFSPRRTWKLARIKEIIFSKDNCVRSAVVQLPNKNIISRAINHLFPLEVPPVASDEEIQELTNQSTITEGAANIKGENDKYLSGRKAALQARERIAKLLSDEATTVCFTFPGSVMKT